MKIKKLLLILLLLVMFEPTVLAKPTEVKSFRSPYGKYIYVGDYYYTVQKILKNPDDKLHIKRYYGGDFIWVYDHTQKNHVYFLTFKSGKLIRIEYDRKRIK